jgi:DNA primase
VAVRKIDGVWSDKARDKGGSIFDAVMKVRGCDFPEAVQFVADIAGVRSEPTNGYHKAEPQRVETRRVKFPIRDVDGRHVATHVRIEYTDDSKTFIWERPDGRSGLGYHGQIPPPLWDRSTDR